MTSIAELYALQELDLAIASARARLADVEAGIGESDALVDARRELDEGREEHRAAEKAYKDAEFEAEELTRKIEPEERKLYEGGIQNPKELEDIQQELESLKRRRSELDDKALAAMEALEEAQDALREAEERLRNAEQESGAEQKDLSGQKARLHTEIEGLEAQRAEQAGAIEDAALLQLYDKLASTRGGRAIAKIEGGGCSGCRISLPMNVLQRARAGNDLVQCSSCERILFVG